MKELIGKPAMVHPLLPTDPADRQGHLGTITHVSYDNEIIEVSFEDGGKSLYLTDSLLVLKSHRELSRDISDAHQQLDAKDIKTLTEISELLEGGEFAQQHEAFDMALVNEQVLRSATVSLTSRLELMLPEDMHPYWQKGTGR